SDSRASTDRPLLGCAAGWSRDLALDGDLRRIEGTALQRAMLGMIDGWSARVRVGGLARRSRPGTLPGGRPAQRVKRTAIGGAMARTASPSVARAGRNRVRLAQWAAASPKPCPGSERTATVSTV